MYITNYTGEIQLPYTAELLVWLQKTYPHSRYIAKEKQNDTREI
jgi:hypothetical protein